MTKRFFKFATSLVFIFCALCIMIMVFFPLPWNAKKNRVEQQARIIIPQELRYRIEDMENPAELMARQESLTSKVALAEGEVIVSVLNGSFEGSPMESQFVAYRNLLEIESPIYLTYIDYDVATRGYKRLWSAPTAATRPGTISLYTQDLLGDRSVCVLLFGMNGLGEHTLTIFLKNPFNDNNEHFRKLAELRIEGTITVREVERTQAYQMGSSRGLTFDIAAYGRDFDSSNILDQVEIIYAYNTGNGLYEQRSITRIPGAQVEQRRVRELLGNPRAFEEFVTGLWYYTTTQGTIDTQQYIYFDPASREIIFYGDETQQVFIWQNSIATRYGLYISSQNISVSTLRRSIDIELESLESVRLRVIEDVRLRIGVSTPWDGSYRKAGPLANQIRSPSRGKTSYIDARYDGSMGKINFMPNGTYELNSGGILKHGNYAFFLIDNQEFLELRSTEIRQDGVSAPVRETYLVDPDQQNTLSLLRIRIGSRGIEKLHEGAILLTQVE